MRGRTIDNESRPRGGPPFASWGDPAGAGRRRLGANGRLGQHTHPAGTRHLDPYEALIGTPAHSDPAPPVTVRH